MRLEDWFMASLSDHRDAVALIENRHAWTFGDVDLLSRVWATEVRRRLAPGRTAVAVLAGRSAVGYIGALAALRAGAVLVPLNPTFPAARTITMATAAGVGAVIVDASVSADLVDDVRASTGVPVVSVDARKDLGEAPADAGPRHRPGMPTDTAYVLFTSGSSGTPKGVPISHANVSAFLTAAVRRYPMTPDDRMVQAYDMTFDLALASLYLAWAQGCPIVPASVFALADPAKFAAKYGITVWASVPSAIELASAAGKLSPGCLPTLRLSMFCGEAFTVDAASRWTLAAPASTIDNTYGPTELTMFCTAHRWQPQEAPTYAATVPIGAPFEGTEAMVVDAFGQPAPTGELLLRGDQMFAGYLDPRNDEHAFTPEGFSERRWYRTGDLVARGPHGLTHLGRVDDQLQVGGHRVEPAEVEHVIRATLGVTTAIVVQRSTSLVAFVAPAPVEAQALNRLATVLPAYMCPTRIVGIDELRRNANGKIDRTHYKNQAAAMA